MEKIFNIDGREVRLKSTAALPLYYKAQFGRDIFADLNKLAPVADGDMDEFDAEIFYNIIWAMAKSADKSLPPLMEWLDTFDSFPIFEMFVDANELLLQSIGKSSKNTIAAGTN